MGQPELGGCVEGRGGQIGHSFWGHTHIHTHTLTPPHTHPSPGCSKISAEGIKNLLASPIVRASLTHLDVSRCQRMTRQGLSLPLTVRVGQLDASQVTTLNLCCPLAAETPEPAPLCLQKPQSLPPSACKNPAPSPSLAAGTLPPKTPPLPPRVCCRCCVPLAVPTCTKSCCSCRTAAA